MCFVDKFPLKLSKLLVVHHLIQLSAGIGTWCPVMITHRADSDWEQVSHLDNIMS